MIIRTRRLYVFSFIHSCNVSISPTHNNTLVLHIMKYPSLFGHNCCGVEPPPKKKETLIPHVIFTILNIVFCYKKDREKRGTFNTFLRGLHVFNSF